MSHLIMGYEKQLEIAKEIVQSQPQIDGLGIKEQRRSANYTPSVWKYDFLQSLRSKFDEEQCQRQIAEFISDVKSMFRQVEGSLSKLQLVDRIIKIGLRSQFQKEIKEAIEAVAALISSEKFGHEQSLYAAALSFRLLRQHGYRVSQDMFCSFLNENGDFVEGSRIDTKGLIELYEASYFSMEGETVLEDAKIFSTLRLKESLQDMESYLAKQVIHALELPSHWRIEWFDVQWQINTYKQDIDRNKRLLDLAILNFNFIQSTLQKDLRDISRWWRDLDLINKMDFARDRLVESFLCTVGLVYEPQFSSFRKCLSKVIVMILVIDDVYDIYGSLEELKHFTLAFTRWDIEDMENLPKCMTICFQALDDITNEITYEVEREKGWSQTQIQPYLKTVWGDFCKALLVEAKWYNKGSTPSFREYLNNAWISASGTVLSVHSFFCLMNEESLQMKNFFERNQDLFYNVGLIIRLCNDMGTSAAEQERGDVASSILCYMKEAGVTEKEARDHIKSMIDKAWKKINGKCSTDLSMSIHSFANININMVRVAHNLYNHGDGFGDQDCKQKKKQILSLLIEPLPFT